MTQRKNAQNLYKESYLLYMHSTCSYLSLLKPYGVICHSFKPLGPPKKKKNLGTKFVVFQFIFERNTFNIPKLSPLYHLDHQTLKCNT